METEFEDETFKEQDYSGEEHRDFTWESCEFHNCKFNESSLPFSRFSDCTFVNCDFSGMNPSNARFQDCKFNNCKLVGVNWCDVGELRTVEFEECLLNYGIYANLKLQGIVFKKCKIHEADFAECNLEKAEFSNCDLSQTNFNNSNLFKADFRGAVNYSIDPNFTRIQKAKFSMPEAANLLQAFDIELN